MYFDTHAHLNDPRFDADRAEVLEQCRRLAVSRIVEIADEPGTWDKALALSRSHPEQIHCALGIHPYYADQWQPGLMPVLSEQARKPEVVAIGEIGLDYAKCPLTPELQKSCLTGMLSAAWDMNLPVILHCREAYQDMVPMLKDFYNGRPMRSRWHGVVHCFSGNREDALEIARLGFALGVDGPVTYPKNSQLREALLGVGIGSLVLETDSPYLPPQSSRGKRNEPGAVLEIAAKLSELFRLPLEQVAHATSKNAFDLFRL